MPCVYWTSSSRCTTTSTLALEQSWLAGWLAGCLVGCLVGWPVCPRRLLAHLDCSNVLCSFSVTFVAGCAAQFHHGSASTAPMPVVMLSFTFVLKAGTAAKCLFPSASSTPLRCAGVCCGRVCVLCCGSVCGVVASVLTPSSCCASCQYYYVGIEGEAEHVAEYRRLISSPMHLLLVLVCYQTSCGFCL